MQQTVSFSVTGVDYTGPLYVRSNNGEIKNYICLFVCATTRAIHLEVVSDLSEISFLQAFRWFASRKSLPNRMVSDNASTFTASADEPKELFQSPRYPKELLGLVASGSDLLDLPRNPSRKYSEDPS
jgi:hypothetical protein